MRRVKHPPTRIWATNEEKLIPFADYVAAHADGPAGPVAFQKKWRTTDGSGNSAKYPFLGQGERGYAMHTHRETPVREPDLRLSCVELYPIRAILSVIAG
jgi:hypothetical protein